VEELGVKVTTININDVKVLRFHGELNTKTAPEAENLISQLLNRGMKKILMNFEALEYISSAGLRLVMFTAQQIKSAGGVFGICSMNDAVNDILDISGFSTILNVYEKEEDALADF